MNPPHCMGDCFKLRSSVSVLKGSVLFEVIHSCVQMESRGNCDGCYRSVHVFCVLNRS